MLTHELERPENLNTYLTRALHPVRPMYTFGRSFDASPAIPRDHAVWSFWQDRYFVDSMSHWCNCNVCAMATSMFRLCL